MTDMDVDNSIVPYRAISNVIRKGITTPYVARRYANLLGPEGNAAAKVLQYAWRNRRFATRYVRNAFKRTATGDTKRYKRETKIGARMVTPTRLASKARRDFVATIDEAFFVPMNNLNVDLMPYPVYDTGNVLGSRDQYNIKIKGWKICRQFQLENPGPEAEEPALRGPVVMHWALVQQKETKEIPDYNDLRNAIRERFFRDHSANNDRYRAFEDSGPTDEWRSYYNCLPMNPDGGYAVLTHLRRRLTPNVSGVVDPNDGIWQLDKYIPINKIATFGQLSNYVPNHPVYEVYWYSMLCPNQHPTGFANTTYVRTFKTHTIYYDENVDVKNRV